MAYSTVVGVKAYFGSPAWSTVTTPTLLEVENWCDEAAAIIDSYIASVVTTPITDTTDLKIIRAISDMYVVDNVNFVMSKNRIMMQQNSESVPRTITHKAFYDRLDMIKDRTIILQGSITSNIRSTYSGANTNDLAFVAKKDEEQW